MKIYLLITVFANGDSWVTAVLPVYPTNIRRDQFVAMSWRH